MVPDIFFAQLEVLPAHRVKDFPVPFGVTSCPKKVLDAHLTTSFVSASTSGTTPSTHFRPGPLGISHETIMQASTLLLEHTPRYDVYLASFQEHARQLIAQHPLRFTDPSRLEAWGIEAWNLLDDISAHLGEDAISTSFHELDALHTQVHDLYGELIH